MSDDFDQPNTLPGNCPECGQPASIWLAVSQQWECVYCNWQGRNPKRDQQSPHSVNFFVDM
jgi:ribosomal protein L37AE/L43A